MRIRMWMRVHLFVVALVGFVICPQQRFVALRLAPDVLIGVRGEDAGGGVP